MNSTPFLKSKVATLKVSVNYQQEHLKIPKGQYPSLSPIVESTHDQWLILMIRINLHSNFQTHLTRYQSRQKESLFAKFVLINSPSLKIQSWLLKEWKPLDWQSKLTQWNMIIQVQFLLNDTASNSLYQWNRSSIKALNRALFTFQEDLLMIQTHEIKIWQGSMDSYKLPCQLWRYHSLLFKDLKILLMFPSVNTLTII